MLELLRISDLRQRLKICTLSCTLLTLLYSCGESSNKTDDSFGANPDLSAGCEINEDNLDNFLSRAVPDDIDCLRAHLELFVRVVKPTSPETVGQLSQANLEAYILTEEPKLKKVLKYTPLFFNLSHVIFGDELGYLSGKFILPLTQAAIEINRELAAIYPLFDQRPSEELYRIHKNKREAIVKSVANISASLEKLFKNPNVNEKPLSIPDLLDIFVTDTNAGTIKKIRDLIFVKRLVAGGDFSNITQVELRKIISQLPKFVHLVFDFLQFNAITFDKETYRYKFFKEALDIFESSLHFKEQPSAVLFQISDLENALISLEDDIGIKNLKNYFSIIPELKAVFGSNPEVKFLRSDIDSFIKHLNVVITYGEAFSDTFYAKDSQGNPVNQRLLESNERILDDLLIHNPLYSKQFADFVRIAKNYRFFRGSNPVPFYGDYYSRNLNGMIEAITIEYLFGIYASYYEDHFPCGRDMYIRPRPHGDPATCTKDNAGKCIEDLRCKNGEDLKQTLSQGQVEYIFVRLSDALFQLDIITKQREYSSAESAMLLNDLFQFQSNSNQLIDKFEAAELGGQIISAIGMKDNILNTVKTLCAPTVSVLPNGDTKFGTDCFRDNFKNVLYEHFERKPSNPNGLPEIFQYAEYMPRLMSYLDSTDTQTVAFLQKLEEFTRTCYKYFKPEEDFLYDEDVVGVFGGLFNLESTLTRFDTDPVDNVLTGPEVERAYEHFQSAVQGLLANAITPSYQWIVDLYGPNTLAKKAFYYMLKYKELPNLKDVNKALQFVGFLLKSDYKDGIKVDRLTMAAVLSGIKSSSKNKAPKWVLDQICHKQPITVP